MWWLTNHWAGFSPKYEGDFELSSISDEISTISKIVKGKNFIGEASKKQSFLDNNKDFSILHLAMHAEIDNENKRLSFQQKMLNMMQNV